MPDQAVKVKLESILNRFNSLGLECDGFTRVATHSLKIHGVSHKVFYGRVDTNEHEVPVHYWIEAGGWTVDYCLRMWTDESMPHGVFVPPADVIYQGQECNLPCSPVVFDILTNGMEP